MESRSQGDAKVGIPPEVKGKMKVGEAKMEGGANDKPPTTTTTTRANKKCRMGNGDKRNGKAKTEKVDTHSSSTMTLATLARIELLHGSRREANKRIKFTMHDNTSPGYAWLLPGWIAEERRMDTGRVYRYYYDPAGCLYRNQHEVTNSWEESGLIVLDM